METKEIKQKFDELKKQCNFKANYEELDDIFYLTDFFKEKGFLSDKFSRQLLGRMIDTLAKWNEFLHRILVPNAGSIVVIEESKIFTDSERREINVIFNKIMEFISRNSVIGVSLNNSKEGELIDDIFDFWNQNKGKFVEFLSKINKMWNEKSHEKKERVSYSG
jgi:hypothetical protein